MKTESLNLQLTHIILSVKELNLSKPGVERLDARTCTGIFNAWCASAVIDQNGAVWVAKDKLHTILRTQKKNTTYLLRNVKDDNKRTMGKTTYIRGTEIYQLLDTTIQCAGGIGREELARYSEIFYRLIRDSPEAKYIRAQYYAATGKSRRRLKTARQIYLNIHHDELTGKLLQYGCEFSHIRSVASHFSLATSYWNGLLVNKETHQLITKHNIHDEEALQSLCLSQQWKTDWYTKYKQTLRVNGY
jgi:hypothetical protein